MTFRRCLRWLLAVVIGPLAGWSGLIQPLAAMGEPAELPVAHTYISFDQSALVTDTVSWRGPPAAYDHASPHDADDRWLNGASPRPSDPRTGAIYAHDDTAPLARADATSRFEFAILCLNQAATARHTRWSRTGEPPRLIDRAP